jgi:hypothetical protein
LGLLAIVYIRFGEDILKSFERVRSPAGENLPLLFGQFFIVASLFDFVMLESVGVLSLITAGKYESKTCYRLCFAASIFNCLLMPIALLTSCTEFTGPEPYHILVHSQEFIPPAKIKNALAEVKSIIPGAVVAETASLSIYHVDFSLVSGGGGIVSFVGPRNDRAAILSVSALNKTTWTLHDDGEAERATRAIYAVLQKYFPDLPKVRDVVWPRVERFP